MGAYCPDHKPCRDLRIGNGCAPRGAGASSAHNRPHHTPHSGHPPPVTDRIDNRARMVRLGNRTDNSWLFLSLEVGVYRRDHVSPRAGPENGPMEGPLFFFVLHPRRGKVFSDSRASPVRRLISRPCSHLFSTPPQRIHSFHVCPFLQARLSLCSFLYCFLPSVYTITPPSSDRCKHQTSSLIA